MSTTEAPPPFEQTNVVDLTSVNDSKIVSVSLYSGRAEVTRSCKFAVQTGQNQVVISGLPNVVDKQSLRVEGRGAATIHDVALSDIPVVVPSTSTTLEDLLSEKQLTQKSLDRTKKAIYSLENYLLSLKVEHIGIVNIAAVMDGYEESGQKLDAKCIDLGKKLSKIDERIKEERSKLSGPAENSKLMLRATISVFADTAGRVEIVLVYAVTQATWNAAYDIRVDMQTKDEPVTLIYKARITQNTGEPWVDVPLILETASPTFGLGIPRLSSWTVSTFSESALKATAVLKTQSRIRDMRRSSLTQSILLDISSGVDQRSAEHSLEEEYTPDMNHRVLPVSSKGSISATFKVPGIITIPNDGAVHNVTIVKLNLDASMSWVTVPKIDTKVHLKAKIQNTSDYTLLQGPASVYVNGSFISRSRIPLVSPSENFDCPLGLDPTIRVTYHPQTKKVSQSGFYSKTSTHVFSQRITIFNSKSSAITNFKVNDQIPVSQNSTIIVKLITPSLTVAVAEPSALLPSPSTGEETRVSPPVNVSEGVIAQWEGADEQGYDTQYLGRTGKFYWLCSVPPQGKVNLLLSWEVSAPLRTRIAGL